MRSKLVEIGDAEENSFVAKFVRNETADWLTGIFLSFFFLLSSVTHLYTVYMCVSKYWIRYHRKQIHIRIQRRFTSLENRRNYLWSTYSYNTCSKSNLIVTFNLHKTLWVSVYGREVRTWQASCSGWTLKHQLTHSQLGDKENHSRHRTRKPIVYWRWGKTGTRINAHTIGILSVKKSTYSTKVSSSMLCIYIWCYFCLWRHV